MNATDSPHLHSARAAAADALARLDSCLEANDPATLSRLLTDALYALSAARRHASEAHDHLTATLEGDTHGQPTA